MTTEKAQRCAKSKSQVFNKAENRDARIHFLGCHRKGLRQLL